ncbi:unnamed protein product [Pieris brassicae]|uniref:Tc1-like transposase DDE domain-containing protein n=1 Tax=Pieris brassicae TaxID=7116 RepID=A0A9P0XC33_PIEBR|nr:unnamed protein product [Pieris brassicae]
MIESPLLQVLRLPPYHCDLNPSEMVWASMKRKVAMVNIGKLANEMPNLASDSEESSDSEDEDEDLDDIRPLNIVHLDHNYNKII